MDESLKASLVEQFRAYLDQADDKILLEPPQGIDLYSLFGEMITLKTEVKAQTYQLKSVLDQIKEGFANLESHHALIQETFIKQQQISQQKKEEMTRQQIEKQTLRPILLQIIEIRDRMDASIQAIRHPVTIQGWMSRFCRDIQEEWLQNIQSGQEITIRRVDQLLTTCGVHAIEVVGRFLDPHIMKVSELEQRSDVENGMVTVEIRKGYSWGDEILRLAEVRVNKKEIPTVYTEGSDR